MNALRVFSAVLVSRLFLLATLVCTAAHAQPPTPVTLSRNAQDVLTAIESNDPATAADLAARLDDGVQQQLRDSIAGGSRQRIGEVLGLLPVETETLLALRDPFVIHAGELAPAAPGHLVQVCLTERLAALNGGRYFNALNGETVQLAVAGLSNLRPRSSSAPAVMPDADGAWFYYLSAPVNAEGFGQPRDMIGHSPVWRAVSSGSRREESWLALARPDLLILATSRNVLTSVLGRMAKPDPQTARALPADLAEWRETDTNASAFGLRHFTSPQEGSNGLSFAWDSTSGLVLVRYSARAGEGRDRGDYSVAAALTQLGFGSYR